MTKENKLGEISMEELSESSLAKVAKSIYQKDTLTEAELMTILEMDLEMFPKELTVSAAETRQVRQYESNNYHLSMKLDLGECQQVVLGMVRSAPEDKRIAAYVEGKKLLYGIIREKYSRNENYLRDLIRAQKTEDGIKN
jgi:hypothetical protein